MYRETFGVFDRYDSNRPTQLYSLEILGLASIGIMLSRFSHDVGHNFTGMKKESQNTISKHKTNVSPPQMYDKVLHILIHISAAS